MTPKAVVVVRLAVLAGLGWIQSPSTTTSLVFARAFVHPSTANRNANRNRATAAMVAPLFGATGSGEIASTKASQVDGDVDVDANADMSVNVNVNVAPKTASEPARDVVAEMTDKALVEMGPHEMTLEDVAEALRKEGFSTTTGGDDDGDEAQARAVLDHTWADALELGDSSTTTTTTIPTEVRLIVQDPDEDEDEEDAAPVVAATAAAAVLGDDKKEGQDIDQLVNKVLEKNGLSDAEIEIEIETDEQIAETDHLPAMSVASTTATDVEQEKADPVNSKLEIELENQLEIENEIKNENENTDVPEVTWFELFGAAAEVAGAIGSVAVKAASKTLGDVASKLPGDAAGGAMIRADVSVPYESASFMAYTEWLMEHNKEDPLLERYGYFQNNYKRVTIANVIAKKKMREMAAEAAAAAVRDESDTEQQPKPNQRESAPPQLLALDQYADLSEEEYREVQKSLEPKSLGDLFGDLANRTGKAAMGMASAVAPSSDSSSNSGSEDLPPSTDLEPDNKPLFSVGSVSFSFPKKKETTTTMASDIATTNTKTNTNANANANTNTAKGEKDNAKPGPAANHLVSMLSGSFPAIRSDVDKTVDAEQKQKQKQTEPTDLTPPKSHPFSFLAGGFRSTSKKESVQPGKASTTQESPTKKKKQQQQVTAKSPTFLARAPLQSTETKTPPTKQRKQQQQQNPKTTLLQGMMMRRNAAAIATKPESSSPRTAKAKASTNTNLFAPFVSRTLSASSTSNSNKNKNKRKTQVATAKGVPALSQWRQNRDGSITGYVSNSQTYRTGTKITTSPISGEARAGTVVETDSGSKYRLK